MSLRDIIRDHHNLTPVTCCFSRTLSLSLFLFLVFLAQALDPCLITNKDRFTAAVINMAVETMILSIVSHPHILPMRAFNGNGMLKPGHFIVLDRLYETLQVRIHRWRLQSRRRVKSTMNGMKKTSDKHLKTLIETKLRYAYDLSGALEYLHASKYVRNRQLMF